MADERTITLLIKAIADKELSLQSAEAILKVRDSILATAKAADSVNSTLDKTASAMSKVGQNTDLQAFVDKLKEANAELDQTSEKAEALSSSGGGGAARLPMSGARGLRYAGMFANQVGGAGAGTGLMMAGELEGVVSVLQQIGPAAIPAAAGLGLLAIGIAHYNDTLKESESTLHNAISSLDAYYKAIETGTQESIAAQLKLLTAQLENAKTKRDQLESAYTTATQTLSPDSQGSEGADLRGAASGVSAGTRELADSYNKAKKEADDLQSTIDGLNRAYDSEAVIVRSLIADLDKQASQQTEYRKLEEEGSSKQAEARISDNERRLSAIKDEQEALTHLAPTDDVLEKMRSLSKEQADLNNQNNILESTIVPLIQAREEEAAAAKKLNTTLQDVVKNNEALAKMDGDQAVKEKRQKEDEDRLSQRQMVEDAYKNQIAFAKEQEQIDKVRSAGAQKDQEAVAKEQEDAAKLNADYMQKAQKNLQDFNERESRLTQDHSKQKLRDLQDAQDKLRSLAASGDVAGFVEQQHAINKKLTRDDQDFSEAEQRRHADFIKEQNELEVQRQIRLNELESTFQAERAKRQEAQDQRIKEIEENGKAGNSKSAQLEAELNNIREQWRREDLDRQHAAEEEDFARRRDATVQNGNELVQIVTSQFQQMGAAAQNYLQMSGGSSQPFQMPYIPGLSDFGKVGGDFLDSIFGLPSFDTGGDINQDMIIKAHKGERVLTASENSARQRGGGPIFNINLDATVGDVATKQFVEQTANMIVDGAAQAYQNAKGKGDF